MNDFSGLGNGHLWEFGFSEPGLDLGRGRGSGVVFQVSVVRGSFDWGKDGGELGGTFIKFCTHSSAGTLVNLRRSATEAQLGLVIEFASEIELLFESRFELKFELAINSEL